jgi:Domain of unknown function (DUF4082)
MSRMKVRVSGAWVATDRKHKYRQSGAWVSGPPSGGPTYEALTWPNTTPNLLNADDGATRYNMGIRFKLTNTKNCVGIQWRAPTTTPSPTNATYPVGHSVSLWNADTSTLIGSKAFTPTPAVYQDILFDTPYLLTGGLTEYIAAVYTFHYVHRAGTWPVTSPSGNIVADKGRLIADQGPNRFPAGGFDAWYYVSPLISL